MIVALASGPNSPLNLIQCGVLSSKDKKFEPNPSEVLRVEFNIDGRGYESSGVALIVPVAKLEPSGYVQVIATVRFKP